MKSRLFLSFLSLAVLVILSAGCSKKSTKVDTTPSNVMKPVTTNEIEQGEKDQAKGAGIGENKIQEETVSESKPPLRFRVVYFDFDSFNIPSSMRDVLAEDARVLKAYPNVKIRIEGHCDERGTTEYNLALGDRRAQSVKNYLTSYGISPNRVSTISYGEEHPVDTGHTEAAWAKNRRAEFNITQQ